VTPDKAEQFEQLAGDVPCARIGTVGGRDLEIPGEFIVSVAEMKAAHQATMPTVFEVLGSATA
jgi:phosphoribosylformylglycinamidine synthase